jgi:hypothetical protein
MKVAEFDCDQAVDDGMLAFAKEQTQFTGPGQ